MERETNFTTESAEQVITRRSAEPSDTEFARRVRHEAYRDVVVRQFGEWDEDFQNELFEKDWASASFEILLCNNIPCGYCAIQRTPEYIFVYELVISLDFQGKGIGSGVLREVIAEARERNVPVRLEVLKENKALNLYQKFGFTITGENETHTKMELHPNSE